MMEDGRCGWRRGDGEKGEDLLRGLKETDAAQFLVGDTTHGNRSCKSYTIPVVGGEYGLGLILTHEVANDFRAFCHEAVFTLAELLLFQLTDIFYLIFANHFGFCLQR